VRTVTRAAPPAAVLAALSLVALSAGAGATAGVTATRLSGADRYGTSQAIALAAFPKATVVVLASGADVSFPDALSASGNYLGGHLGAPLLLTDPASLSPGVLSTIQSMGATGVEVVGGSDSVSQNDITQLQSAGLNVTVVAGADRYGTAAAVAEAPGTTYVGSVLGKRTAVLATGTNFPDALAGGALAFAGDFPLLLTDPNTLPTATANALTALNIGQVLVLGGSVAISVAVESAVQSMGITTMRLAGFDRMGTATAIAGFELANLGFSNASAAIAPGDTFPDALSGGPYAGHNKMPMLLTFAPTSLSTESTAFLQSESSTLTSLTILGGPGEITDATVAQAQAAAT
jgi:putative cell wall-binding protein